MATRKLTSHIDRFAGLSDRSIPVQNTRIECSDLVNLDFSERSMKVRPGYTRLNSAAFKDCCRSLDGYNDFGRIKGLSVLSDTQFGFAVEVQLRAYPTTGTTPTVLSIGFGTGANRYLWCYYDPGSTGSWIVKAYDATAGVLRTFTVTDGDAARSQVMKARHLEFVCNSGTTYKFTVRDDGGTSLGSDSQTITTFPTLGATVKDVWVGVDTAAGTDAPAPATATSYGAFNLAALRFYDGSSAAITASAAISGRDLVVFLDEHATAGMVEYFPLNEGTGNQSESIADSTNGAVIQWGANTPEWNTTTTEVIGQTGLEFGGEEGEIIWNLGSGTSTTIFSNAGTGYRKWLVTFVFTPRMAAGETTVRNQTLLWWGTSTTIPAPLGIRVESDNIKTYYRDGAATSNHSVALALSSFVGVRLRVQVSFQDSAATPAVTTVVYRDGAVGATSATSAPATSNPSSISDNVCVGRLCTSFTYPYTFNDRSAFGVIDDIVIFKDYSLGYTPGLYLPIGLQMREVNVSDVTYSGATSTAAVQIVAGMRLNDGTGNNLATIGNATSQQAYLFPEEDDGVWGDNGFIAVSRPPEIDLIADFSRVGPKGTLVQEVLVLCGGGLWAYNQSTGDIRGVGFVPKEGKASFTQYGSVAYIGRGNGSRPMRCDGATCYSMGIRAPIVAPGVAAAAGTGPTAGTYYVYYTFRNSQTGVESNPSPVASVTTSGGNLSIAVNLLQRSSDRQVNQRRIYIATTSAGSAYLAMTLDDNLRYGDGVTALVTYTAATAPTTNVMPTTSNREAPTGSLVRVFKDRMWVAGVPLYPTRVYYSAVGNMEHFNWSTGYVDVDLDTGDPVVGLTTMYDRLVAYHRDGRVFVTPTLDTTKPFVLNFASGNVGAVAHNAIISADHPPVINDKQGLHVFIADSQIASWDGGGTENLTSPPGYDRPSIEYTYREKLNRVYAHKWTAAPYTTYRQLWFAVSSTGSSVCDTVLIFDVGQGVWTKYALDCEFLAEVDDANSVPSMMFGQAGYLCKVAAGEDDTTNVMLDAMIAASSWAYTSDNVTFVEGEVAGLRAYFYDASAARWYMNRIVYNSTTHIYMDTTGTQFPSVTSSDYIVVGGIPVFADFVVDFGSTLPYKRLRWLSLAGEARGGINAHIVAGRVTRDPSFTNATTYTLTTTLTDPTAMANVGGLGRVFNLRIGGDTSTGKVGAPQAAGDFITEIEVEAEEVEAL